MNDSRSLGRLLRIDVSRRWPFLPLLIWAALTLLAAVAALASAVNAALFIIAATACASLLFAGWFLSSAGGDEAELWNGGTGFASDSVEPLRDSRETLAEPVPPAIVFLPARARADEVAPALFAPQCYFPVAQAGEVVGVLSKAALLRAVANGWGDRLIVELMAEGVAAAECEARSSMLQKGTVPFSSDENRDSPQVTVMAEGVAAAEDK